ncbi:MAG: M1 family metallopeptidase [bacterium]|nr:M1 family metallopeptidase [bacterium]
MKRHNFPWALAALLSACAASCSVPGAGAGRGSLALRADTLEHNGWDRDCDLIHVSLDLVLDFEGRRVHGTVTNWIRALREDTQQVRLHAVGLEVREVLDAAGHVLAFRLEDPWLTIELAEPLAVGEEESLRIRYVARPERGMHFREASKHAQGFAPQIWTQGQREQNRHWLPTWDYPSDRATVDAKLRVGFEMTALSNGELLGVDVHDLGERTFRWRTAQSIPTYLIAVAAGRWERYADEWQGLPLEYYVAPGTGEERARRAFGETPAMMAFFTELLDEPYPYAKYAQVAVTDFRSAGMENASLTIVHDRLIGDAEEIADLDGDPRLLVAHELAHQWFGNHVTCFGWSHLWLNEAWASYLEILYEGHVAGEGRAALWLERYREWYQIRPDADVPVVLDWRTQSAGDRANHLYTKGPWILHMIRARLGDEAFWRATRAYLDRHAGGLVTTGDFVRTVFDETGVNLEGFVEQWVEGGGFPRLEVSFEAAAGDVLELDVRQVQETSELVPLFEIPLELDLYYVDGTVARHRVRLDGEQETLRLPLHDAELANVVIDPAGVLLCAIDLDKPLAMWMHQSTLQSAPAMQWRALPRLRELAEREDRARVAILRLATEGPEELLRERASTLADFDDPRAVDVLMRLATSDPAPRVRRAAVHTLIQHSARSQFEPGGDEYEALLTRVGIEPSPAVRSEIQELLELEP